MLREGLDETTVADLKQLLATAMQKLKQQRLLEAQEAREAAAAEARRVEEALALQEARARAARDEADWSAYLQANMDDDRLLLEAKPSPALFELELLLLEELRHERGADARTRKRTHAGQPDAHTHSHANMLTTSTRTRTHACLLTCVDGHTW